MRVVCFEHPLFILRGDDRAIYHRPNTPVIIDGNKSYARGFFSGDWQCEMKFILPPHPNAGIGADPQPTARIRCEVTNILSGQPRIVRHAFVICARQPPEFFIRVAIPNGSFIVLATHRAETEAVTRRRDIVPAFARRRGQRFAEQIAASGEKYNLI